MENMFLAGKVNLDVTRVFVLKMSKGCKRCQSIGPV